MSEIQYQVKNVNIFKEDFEKMRKDKSLVVERN